MSALADNVRVNKCAACVVIGRLKMRDNVLLEVFDDGSMACRAHPDGGSVWYEDPTVAARDLDLDEAMLHQRVLDLIADDRFARTGQP